MIYHKLGLIHTLMRTVLFSILNIRSMLTFLTDSENQMLIKLMLSVPESYIFCHNEQYEKTKNYILKETQFSG
jgi:hypothetical protein